MKKIIALILASTVILSGFSLNGNVGEFRRTVEGCVEIFVRALRSTFGSRNYTGYTEICDIPETENGYVPQGYCYNESENLHFVSYYHAEMATIISIVDAENGKRVKTINLKKLNGKDFKGHAGGIAEDGTYFYVVDGKKIYRLNLNELFNVEDGGSVTLENYITTDVKCSYINCDGKYLYAGEFYTFDFDGSYDTDKLHHVAYSLFETSYARCNAYLLDNISFLFSAGEGEITAPDMIFTTPNCVQGFARLPDGGFALSISYGRNNNSSLAYYDDVTKQGAVFTVQYGEKNVPVYKLSKSNQTSAHKLPPLLEGIDDVNGKAAGIFESCAQKYSDAAFIVEEICIF